MAESVLYSLQIIDDVRGYGMITSFILAALVGYSKRLSYHATRISSATFRRLHFLRLVLAPNQQLIFHFHSLQASIQVLVARDYFLLTIIWPHLCTQLYGLIVDELTLPSLLLTFSIN